MLAVLPLFAVGALAALPVRHHDTLVIFHPTNGSMLFDPHIRCYLATVDRFGHTTHDWDTFRATITTTEMDFGNRSTVEAASFPTLTWVTIPVGRLPAGRVLVTFRAERQRDGFVASASVWVHHAPNVPVRAPLRLGVRFGGRHPPPLTRHGLPPPPSHALLLRRALDPVVAAARSPPPGAAAATAVGQEVVAAAGASWRADIEDVSDVTLALALCAEMGDGCDLPEFVGVLGGVKRNPAVAAHPAPLPPFQSRTDLAHLFEAEGFKVGVEVGSQRAWFADEILSGWPSGDMLFLVDPWEEQHNYFDGANVATQNLYLESAMRRVGPTNRTYFVQDYSVHAALMFPDGVLDFAYVDARHNYASVLEDLETWWPKIRPGGILAGHDFLTAGEVSAVPGQVFVEVDGLNFAGWSVQPDGSVNTDGKAVKQAVLEFAARVGRQVSVQRSADPYPSWMMRR